MGCQLSVNIATQADLPDNIVTHDGQFVFLHAGVLCIHLHAGMLCIHVHVLNIMYTGHLGIHVHVLLHAGVP